MERQFVLRCGGFGLLAGLLSFIFAKLWAEPIISRAIDYEEGRDEAQDALDKAAGIATGGDETELFSRTIQSTVGIGTGMVLMGFALGLLYAVVFSLYLRYAKPTNIRAAAIGVAAAMFACLYIVPCLKYPSNPPAVGNPDTIKQRTWLFLTMIIASVIVMIGVVFLHKVLSARMDSWIAFLISAVVFAVIMYAFSRLLPSLGHLHADIDEFGRHNSETPRPLTDPDGKIVYPGFPADDLYYFRVYSFMAQCILWGVIGFGTALVSKKAIHKAAVQAEKEKVAA